MKKHAKFIAAIFAGIISSANAASYTTLTQGLDKTATPYNIGINLNGIWYNFATITAGGAFNLPISSGGTGQATASAAFNALSPMTTAGDLIYGGASGAGTRLPAGTAAQFLMSGTTPSWITMSGDATLAGTGALTLATVNANVGSWGSATQAPQITIDAKGRITAAANVTVTPAIGSVTGLGAGVGAAAALATNANGGFPTVSVSATAPTTPSLFQPWLNTTAAPYVWNIWDGASWVALGTIDATTHAIALPTLDLAATPSGGFGGVIGILPSANGGAGSINGALKGNGAGLVSQAACADLSNSSASCSTDATNAANDNYTQAGAGGATRTISQVFDDYVFATGFTGVDPTGATDSSTGLQNAIARATMQAASRGMAAVYLPCGIYLISSTLTIESSNVSFIGQSKSCVQVRRVTDFGPTLKVANAAGRISGVMIAGVNFLDLAAGTGSPSYSSGWSTCATSPYHLIVDGVNGVTIENVDASYGCGGIALLGVYNVFVHNVAVGIYQIPNQAGLNGAGTGFYVGTSVNANLTTKYSANVFVSDVDIEGGSSVATSKLQYGWNLDGVDGVWATNTHVEYTTTADYRFGTNTASPMWNVFFDNAMADIPAGAGVLLDGTQQVERFHFAGFVTAAQAQPVAYNGVQISGTGGCLNCDFDIGVDGFGANGFLQAASNVSNLSIHVRHFKNNNFSAGAFDDISIGAGSDVSIIGGTIDGTNNAGVKTARNGVTIGASVAGFTMAGTNVKNHTGYGVSIAAGALRSALSGNTFDNNTSGAVQNNAGAANLSASGNVGLPWFAYTPTLSCAAGALTTSSATGKYSLDGKNVSINIDALITTNGTCATSLIATLPIASLNNAIIGGAETAASGQSIKGSISATQSLIGITKYDNTYPMADGARAVLTGVYEAQ